MRPQSVAGFATAERGATATEYALLIAGVAVMLIATIILFGDLIATNWGELVDLF